MMAYPITDQVIIVEAGDVPPYMSFYASAIPAYNHLVDHLIACRPSSAEDANSTRVFKHDSTVPGAIQYTFYPLG